MPIKSTVNEYYIETSLIIGGALEDTNTFYDWDKYVAWVEETEADMIHNDIADWEIYHIEHHHAMTEEECCCVQYLTDHKPFRSGIER